MAIITMTTINTVPAMPEARPTTSRIPEGELSDERESCERLNPTAATTMMAVTRRNVSPTHAFGIFRGRGCPFVLAASQTLELRARVGGELATKKI
jgi:hypothetical protein